MARKLGAELSHMLKDRGVEVIFGIPGVHNQEMYRGIEEAGLTHILARNEQGAGFMADGYARATGRPGIAYVITGPGLCNILNPVGQAYSDSVPLLVIASCLDETAATHGQLHQMRDQEGAGRAVADWSETARDASAAFALIDRALTEFATRRARPKILHVPISVLESAAPPLTPRDPERRIISPALDPGALDAIVTTLQAARYPLVVLGGGAVPATKAARTVIAKLGAASFTSYAGRGIIAPEDPLGFGAMLGRPESAAVLAEADALLFVGTDLAEVDLWRTRPGHRAPAIWVNTDPEILAAARPEDTCLAVDAAEFLGALAGQLSGTPASLWQAESVAATRARWRSEADAERPGILPWADALAAALPRDAMIFSDMTQFAYLGKEVIDGMQPGHWHHPTGFGTLGYALAAAIGGKIGRPELPVISINGDSGFQYNIQELAVAAELGLSLPIILWDNGKLGEIEDSMIRAQIAPNAVIARNPDFDLLARAYGARYSRLRAPAELGTALQAALDFAGPSLIHLQAQG